MYFHQYFYLSIYIYIYKIRLYLCVCVQNVSQSTCTECLPIYMYRMSLYFYVKNAPHLYIQSDSIFM